MAEGIENIKKVIVAAVLLAAAITGAAWLLNDSDSTQPVQESANEIVQETVEAAVTISQDGEPVTYAGEDGKTALELLKTHTTAKTEYSSFGEFVTGINEVDSTETSYWIFYVNGEAAQVGAADYVTSTGESIEWRLEQI